MLLLLPAGLALLAGLDAALMLLGTPAPMRVDRLPEVHGMLMVLGFVGTLIAVERAICAYRQRPVRSRRHRAARAGAGRPHLPAGAVRVLPRPQGGQVDTTKLAEERPDAVVFNGYVNQYDHRPLPVRVGERVRVWVLDAGPNRASSFHVVGGQFDTVYAEGA